MILLKRQITLPQAIVEEQKVNPMTKDLYLCELSEIQIPTDNTWRLTKILDNHLLIFCTKGECEIQIASDHIPFRQNQFCIIPEGFGFELINKSSYPATFFTCRFNGTKSRIMEKDFTVVRDLIPSVNNLVANRIFLFDELFNNLTKGYYNANLEYVHFCFGHLLATFVYACKTSDDIHQEQNPLVSRIINFMEQNLNKKLSLKEISKETGYSPSYLTSIFKEETGYSPLSYFSHLRITRSCEYLDQSSMKIKEIAFNLGYADPYYFSKDFSKKMGISPRKYRQRLIRENQL